MNPRRKLVLTIYTVQLLAVVGAVLLWNPWWLLATAFGLFLFVSIGLECYMHRYLAHQTYQLSRPAQLLFLLLSVFSLQGSPIMWAAYHITHHKNSDREGDPHPAKAGWRSWLWVDTYSAAVVNLPTVKRLLKDPVARWVHTNYLPLYILTVLGVAALDLHTAVFLFLLPAMWAFHASGLVTVLSHRYGYRNFDTPDQSRNFWLAHVFAGSPLHNNHHANPGRYNDAVGNEIDLHGLLIHHVLRKL